MLEAIDISAGYGLLPVLNGISLGIAKGEIVGLLGRNGAGKTTLLRAITGILPLSGGRLHLRGEEITGQPIHQRARRGIAYVPQGRSIFGRLTVMQNLEVGTRANGDPEHAGIPLDIFEYFPILRERGEQLGATLSGGEQQMLAIGRALCGNPAVLLLDEPSEGIQPNIVHAIGALIPKISSERRVAVLLVEQNLDLVLTAASRCLVMEKGQIVHSGPPGELRDESLLKELLAL